jgi:hypothetical protein
MRIVIGLVAVIAAFVIEDRYIGPNISRWCHGIGKYDFEVSGHVWSRHNPLSAC